MYMYMRRLSLVPMRIYMQEGAGTRSRLIQTALGIRARASEIQEMGISMVLYK